MTATELKDKFLLLYDKIAGNAAPPYLESEIESFLNMAQLEYVKNHYNYKKNNTKEGIEETEKRRKDLSELIKFNSPSVSQDQTGIFPNGTFYDLPNDLMYTLTENATITSENECINNNTIQIKPITHDEYNVSINNPFKKPNETIAWRMDFSKDSITQTKRHELITDGDYTISKYNLRYIKIPSDIDLTNNKTSELNEVVHDEIVNIAVRMATAVTEPSNYQIKAMEQQISE